MLDLKDNASVTGRILAEKEDKVYVDLGFTVLAVPRQAIERIQKAAAGGPVTPTTPPEPAGSLYQRGAAAGSERSVREWVAVLGEAVVQVRTPSSLGSGFIIRK